MPTYGPPCAGSPGQTAARALDALRDGAGYGAYLEQKHMDPGKLEILRLLAAQEPTPRPPAGPPGGTARPAGRARSASGEEDGGAPLVLSTIHSSKGLEYDAVALLDVFDGVLPAQPEAHCRTPEEIRQYEEDRRLFYVAMTRARRQLNPVVRLFGPALGLCAGGPGRTARGPGRTGASGRRGRPALTGRSPGPLCAAAPEPAAPVPAGKRWPFPAPPWSISCSASA